MIRPSPQRRYPNYIGQSEKFIFRQPKRVTQELPFVPFWNPDQYLRDLKENGTDVSKLEKMYAEHPPQEEITFKKKIPGDLNMTPIERLYKRYPMKKPPIEERIRALHEAGYSEEVLLTVMKKDVKRAEDGPKLDEFIFNVFGEMSEKKTASTKKRTIQQILKLKKRVYAMPEPNDEEIPVEDDDNVYEDDEV